MSETLRKYPLVQRALDEVRESYRAQGEDVPDVSSIAGRMAEILESTLPPRHREAVMTAGVLLCRAGSLFNNPAAVGAGDAYSPEVAAIVTEIQMNPNNGCLDPFISKKVLQVYTAYQIVLYEAVLYNAPPDLGESREKLGGLRQIRAERDAAPYLDIGAPRLQALELELYGRAVQALENCIRRKDATAAPLRPGARRPN